MGKRRLTLLTVLACLLSPAIMFVFYHVPTGKNAFCRGNPHDLHFFISLACAVYCLIVCRLHFLQTFETWKRNDPRFKYQMIVSYSLTILFSVMFAVQTALITDSPRFLMSRFLDYLGVAFISIAPAFLFPMGILLWRITTRAKQVKESKHNVYVLITSLTATLFTFGGGLQAMLLVFSLLFPGVKCA